MNTLRMHFTTILGTGALVAAALGCSEAGAKPASDVTATSGATTSGAAASGATTNGAATTTDASARAAKDAFWEAFRSMDLDAIATSRDKMIAIFNASPKDADLATIGGFAYVIPVQTMRYGGPPMDPAKIPAHFELAVRYTQQGVDASPDEQSKIFNTAFAGGVLYSAAMVKQDWAAAQKGREMEKLVTAHMPALGYATVTDLMNGAPRNSPDFATSIDSIFRLYEMCSGVKFDRARPDVRPLAKRPFANPSRDCGNAYNWPHSIQGYLLNFGDILVKNQQPDAARPVYEFISKSEGYDTWNPKFKHIVEERLASDLSKRAAEYNGADPQKQPLIGGGCFTCHGK
ncbi:hypothetical protein LVJ94_37745 [Pendulispora rubella]|uniref:Uncharacterized protein n=1 Tax=Pendulispora rubella TaxID=2741070 RepID=A0ABZ2KVD5_9BACT